MTQIEKAAKKYRTSTANQMYIEQIAFEAGAKWQEQRMYSEGDMYKAFGFGQANNKRKEFKEFLNRLKQQENQ